MQRTYEVAVVINPELTDAETERLGHSLKAVITKLEGKVEEENVWGRKATAYPLDGNDEAYYVFYTVSLPANQVIELERTLKLTEGVLRHLVTLKEE